MGIKLQKSAGYCGDRRRGAEMGRFSDWVRVDGVGFGLSPDASKVRLEKLRIVDGDYDQYGVYWGFGPDSAPMWVCEVEDEEVIKHGFVRGWNRDEAKAEILRHWPTARFYR